MNTRTPPPEKLSALIRLAIDDARRLDRERYMPTAATWHDPDGPDDGNDRPTCLVCVAGAVIARTLECPSYAHILVSARPDEAGRCTTITDEKWRGALWALDLAREGLWLDAFRSLHGDYPNDEEVYEALEKLAAADEMEFSGCDEFDSHLESLNERAREIDELGL